jgi:hypothetical protein
VTGNNNSDSVTDSVAVMRRTGRRIGCLRLYLETEVGPMTKKSDKGLNDYTVIKEKILRDNPVIRELIKKRDNRDDLAKPDRPEDQHGFISDQNNPK